MWVTSWVLCFVYEKLEVETYVRSRYSPTLKWVNGYLCALAWSLTDWLLKHAKCVVSLLEIVDAVISNFANDQTVDAVFFIKYSDSQFGK